MGELAKLGLDGWPLALVAVVLIVTPVLGQIVGDKVRARREKTEKEAAEEERKKEREQAEQERQEERERAEAARAVLDAVKAQLTTTNGGSHVRDALNALGEGQDRIVDELGQLRGTVAELRDGVRAVEIETARLGARVDVLERDRQRPPRWRRW